MSNISEEASLWSFSRESFEHTGKITGSRAVYAVKKETHTDSRPAQSEGEGSVPGNELNVTATSQSITIEELLRKFSRENFNDANYMPLLHGDSEITKPLSLMIKQKRPIWKRPFAKDEMTILAGLERYVSSDCEKEYQEAVKLKVIKEQVIEKGKTAPVDSDIAIGLDVGNVAGITVIADDILLGSVREEYILDPDLRGILSRAVLDADKMIPYQDHELFLVTSVVYSEKFVVVGEREQKRQSDVAFDAPEPLKSKIRDIIRDKEVRTPRRAGERHVWGPILFKYCPVQYSQDTKELEIMKGKFVGQSITIEELLRKFSRENFNDANYIPLLHGHSKITKPLSLMIKQKRPIWKRPFAKDEMTILAGLEKYVSSDCEKEYAVKLKFIKEQVIEKGKTAPVDSDIAIGLDVGNVAGITVIADDNLGSILLGRVREEYILDPDLRGILSIAVLNADKMIPYQDHELFLVTSVVYSEKFVVVGEREQKMLLLMLQSL
ncbi:uncharacterized protein [Acropora muricata]|uniref:uncharacterized protein n=1 Tax=Acropora muricata TaxID=159855 RepID=UPI0034E58ADC